MKRIYSIISLFMMVAAMLVSCSNDESLNTTDATVEFANVAGNVKEKNALYHIPVAIKGEQNGPVYIDVEVTGNSSGCTEDVNYIITSKHIVINAEKKESYIEVKVVDDRLINDDRTFTLTITKARGAKVSDSKASTVVTIKDNDDIPYERMDGLWTVSATNILSESGKEPISWDINLNTYDEGDPNYGTVIDSTPWAIFDGSTPVFDEEGTMLHHQMTFYHNESTGKTTVDMKMGSIMASNLDFGIQPDTGADLTNASIRSATMGMTGLSYTGTITGIVNDTFDEITFSDPVYILVYTTSGIPYMYYGGFENIKIKLKK